VLLVVVAHPDDETFGTGSTIAHAAAAGARVVVCCATRGEAGKDVSGTTANPEELAVVREGELRAAAKVLGADEVVVLGFADSDLEGDMPPGALAAVELESVVAPVADVIARYAPDVVVTTDPLALTDHRDHMRIGDATTRAFRRAAKPSARLYHWTLLRSLMDAWQDEMRGTGVLDEYVEMEIGRPDEEITTIVDSASVYETRVAAIAEHRTQRSPFDGLSLELRHRFLAVDHYVRAVPPWEGGEIERSILSVVDAADD
jgi:LmbE family N-acetylglucosaminyl deacetylase